MAYMYARYKGQCTLGVVYELFVCNKSFLIELETIYTSNDDSRFYTNVETA